MLRLKRNLITADNRLTVLGECILSLGAVTSPELRTLIKFDISVLLESVIL
jgi:hypothetical protein